MGRVVKAAANTAAAKGGEEKSVNGIASGIKGIVEAAEKAGKEGKLESEEVAAAAGEGNAEAGKLFAKKANDGDNGGGEAKDAEKATAASGGTGEMIGKVVKAAAAGAAAKGGEEKSVNGIASGIKGIVEAAEKAGKEGKLESEAVAAAAGEGNADAGKLFAKNANAANGGGGAADAEKAAAASGGKEDMIGKVVKVDAAAAKGGDATSVNGIASGIKGIVEAAEKAGEEGKLESEAAAGEDNKDAGKLFAKKANGGGDAGDAEKAAAAVSAVSGKQILKAIVDAAKGDGEKKGVKDVKEAKNPIEAAIGSTDDNDAAAFDKMKKNDQIAAAIVLRGMAKDGEFALKNDANNAEKGLKSTVESAVNKTVADGQKKW
ncbi:variable large family protein (plasmid) [Borreliella burgdorferi 297]|uniref:variable large family protein n=1 Tax=Borreliella burgdorferi TaxID=139 RepID=UPI0023DE6BD5|nr:variable large family protein [Borreliella burgdorferi]